MGEVPRVPHAPETSEPTIITKVERRDSLPKGDPTDASLVVIYGEGIGRRYRVGPGTFEIGRTAACEVSIEHDSVSRRHARLTWDGSRYHIADLGSTNGTWVNDVVVSTSPLADGDQLRIGRTILKFMTGANVEAAYHDEIYRLMTFDGLTSAYNKRYFDETIDREIARCNRYRREVSLILFDLDHFKRTNDVYGHLAGDTVLRELAHAVRSRIRREDVFARVGGEEFAVLTPEVGFAGAHDAAEKIRRVVEATTFHFEDAVIPTTVSVGVATWRAGERSLDLYRRADEALYKAKAGGRNRVV